MLADSCPPPGGDPAGHGQARPIDVGMAGLGAWDLGPSPESDSYICDLDFERPQRIQGKGPRTAEGGWLLVSSQLTLGPPMWQPLGHPS